MTSEELDRIYKKCDDLLEKKRKHPEINASKMLDKIVEHVKKRGVCLDTAFEAEKILLELL